MPSANESILSALETGDTETAKRLCRQRLEIEPDLPDVLVLLAVSLWRHGNHSEALAIYEKLTRLYPDESGSWRNYAAALRESGDLAAAERALATAVQLAPEDAEVMELHGIMQLELGKPADARNTLLRAFGMAPDSPAIRIHAAQACLACWDWRAENLLRPWREWRGLEDALQSELAEVLVQLGEAESAVELLEDLSRRLPASGRVQLRLAGLYERVNRLAKAESTLQAVAVDQDMRDFAANEIAHQRAHLAVRRGEYDVAQRILEDCGPRDDRDHAHWFALAKVYDKSGDTGAAMNALAQAHARQVDELRLAVPHFFEPAAELLPSVTARTTHAEYADWPTQHAPDASQSPVFVVGFPRSGTTLLEQMLDAHPRLQSMDERPFFNMLASELKNTTGAVVPRDLVKLGQSDCDELRKGYLIMACGKVPRQWNARLVDKNPLNMLWLPMIHRLFPNARVILAVRHPCDVILSCYMQNFRSAVLATVGQSLEHLARGYVAAMENWLYHVDVFKPNVFVSRYEDLVPDMPAQTRRIAGFLGLEDAEPMLKFDVRAREKGYIKTPSYTQVIEPINAKGVGRWQRYREFFEPVLPVLQPMLEHWGYATNANVEAVEDSGER